MRLGSLIEGLDANLDMGASLDVPVSGFAIDNRKVAPGTMVTA